MVYSLVWLEDHIRAAEDDFSSQVADDLEKVLKKKDKQIAWKNNISSLTKRFHNNFKLGDIHVAEIAFSSMSAEYRAACVIIPKGKYVIYYKTVPKKGSEQDRLLNLMRENSGEIRAYVQRLVDQFFS